jgi:hypothetical protein
MHETATAQAIQNAILGFHTLLSDLSQTPTNPLRDIFDTKTVDLVIDTYQASQDSEILFAYYLGHHGSRNVFWLHEFTFANSRLWDGVNGVKSEAHVGTWLEASCCILVG